jgi:hypothetical protein
MMRAIVFTYALITRIRETTTETEILISNLITSGSGEDITIEVKVKSVMSTRRLTRIHKYIPKV